jgi:hypothetical protein
MTHLIKPLAVALKGKGLATLSKRVVTIGQRYGLDAGKMDRALGQLAEILKEFNCKATLPITTVALARNSQVIQKYQAQGIEFAVHGYRHIDHSQLSLEEQQAHFRQASKVFRKHGIQFKGFRSPYLRSNEATLAALSQNNFSYDSSSSVYWAVSEKNISDSYLRVLEFYGADPLSDYPALPYLVSEHNLVRIPYCLPDDESLVERLQWHFSAELEQTWPAMFDQIHQQGELFNLGLHPERTKDCAQALKNTLQKVRQVKSEVWCARLDEVAAWWQARSTVSVEAKLDQDNIWRLRVKGPAGTTWLLRSLEAKSPTEPWFDNYQRASDKTICAIQCHQRPFIGVSPDSAPAMASFLQQQGYVVETSTEPHLYSHYFDRRSFSRQDERPLLIQIEHDNFPLARLARWPNGARSALCITGDIDALTVWDYSLRFLGN